MITQSLTWSLELGSGSYSAVGSTEVEDGRCIAGGRDRGYSGEMEDEGE